MNRHILPRPFLVFLLYVLSPLGLTAAPLKPAPVLTENGSKAEWKGYQFVEADRSGNVSFFRGEAYEIYPVTKKGLLGKPLKLEMSLAAASSPREAAMSTSGAQWLLIQGGKLRLFEDGKEKALPPLPWAPQSVGFRRDTPVVSVLPMVLKGSENPGGDLPWLFELDNDRWEVLHPLKGVTEAIASKSLQDGTFNDHMARVSCRITTDGQGKMWVANQYSYHLQRFSPGGRVLFDLTLDGGEPRKRKDASAPIEITRKSPTQNPVSATSNPLQEKGTYHRFAYESVIYDLVEGRDGRFYILTSVGAGSLALDRYDPVESVLERAPLPLRWKGLGSLASGKDGLYIAPYEAQAGRWSLSWEALDMATWEKLEFEASGQATPEQDGR